MSKTIRKIPWAVPGLAMVAVAAFLAIGLLATHGVQPVAAQDDPDCTVDVGVTNTIVVAVSQACSTPNAAAVVALPGDNGTATGDAEVAWVYAQGGTITGGADISDVWDHDATASAAPNTPAATKFSAIKLDIPPATQDVGGGGTNRSEVEITVTPATGESEVVLYIYYQDGPPIPAANFNHDGDTGTDATDLVKQIDAPTGTLAGDLTITFLGAPAIGVDGEDANSIVDDTLESTTDPLFTDTPESRSKLESRTGTVMTVIESVIDGGSEDHVLTGNDDAVTITATVQDAAGNNLEDVEVTFTATSDPAGVESSTRVVDTADDGTAPRTISSLPTDSGYRVTVAVSADGVNLGSIVIARSGDLATFSALICAGDNENTDDDDGCGANSRPQSVFGDVDRSFRIVTTAQDALGSAAADVSVDSDEDADGIAVGAFAVGVAAVTITADDVEGGRYPITLTATQGSGDDEISLMAIVDITISGPLVMYDVSGPDRIESGTSQTYTVQALDSLGNPAQFDVDQQTTVDIFVEGDAKNSVTVFGVPGGGLDLSDDSEATFRIRAASNAMDGEITIVITGVATIDEATKTVMIGEAAAPMPMLTAPTGVMATADASTVTVTWTDGADAVGHLVLLFNADFSGAPMVSAAPTGSSAEFMDVAAGDYVAVVVSYRSASDSEYAVGTVTVN